MQYLLHKIHKQNFYINKKNISKDNSIVYESNSNFGKTTYKTKLSRVFNTSKSNKYFAKRRQFKAIISKIKEIGFANENGFLFELLLVGLGYKVTRLKAANLLEFELHYSHRLFFFIPLDVSIRCLKKKIVIFGIDKSKLVDIASKIKHLRFPNTYKGKGIKYVEEVLKLKPGKQR